MNALRERKGLAEQMLEKGKISQEAYDTWQRLARDGHTAGMAGLPKTSKYDRSYMGELVTESDYAIQRRQVINKVITGCGRSGGAVIDCICVKGMSLQEASLRLPYNRHQVSGILIVALDVADNIYRQVEKRF